MKKVAIVLLFVLSSGLTFSQEKLTTIPQVQQWKASGKLVSYQNITIAHSPTLTQKQTVLLQRLEEELKDIGISIADKPSKTSIDLFFNTKYIDVVGRANAYTIEWGKKTSISASSYEGLVFATRTIVQLFAQEKYKQSIPGGLVVDYPLYEKRMLLIDVARKFFTIEELKDFIRTMAWVKMNELHLHLSDNSWGGYSAYRLESKKYPKLTAPDGHYSWDEIRDLQNFASVYGISIVPEIDSPGHSLAFTNIRPDLKSTFLTPNYLDITNRDTYPFMEEIIAEVIPHFDAPDFHLGTDEYRIKSIKDDSLKTYIGETFRKYINHFNQIVRKHGKTTRIWSGFEHMPGQTEIDHNITIDMWETSDAKDKSSKGYKLINSSHYYTYIVPGAPYYGVDDKFVYEQWTPEIFSNKAEQNLEQGGASLIGSKMHIWNDLGPTGYSIQEIARLSIPSMMVFSEKMWGTKAYDSLADFKKTLNGLLKIPQTKILKRNFSDEKILYTSNTPIELTKNNPVNMNSETKNVEYPWKLEVTLKRTSHSVGNEVLLSSSLATVYTYIDHVVTKNKGVEEKKKGIGIVRANQTEGDTPLTAHSPSVIIFDYELPLNKSVKMILMGEQGKTSMYIDGKLIGSKAIQMVCPMELVGSKKEPVFNGYIEQIEIREMAVKKSK